MACGGWYHFLLAHRKIRLISAFAMDGILRGAGFTLAIGFGESSDSLSPAATPHGVAAIFLWWLQDSGLARGEVIGFSFEHG